MQDTLLDGRPVFHASSKAGLRQPTVATAATMGDRCSAVIHPKAPSAVRVAIVNCLHLRCMNRFHSAV